MQVHKSARTVFLTNEQGALSTRSSVRRLSLGTGGRWPDDERSPLLRSGLFLPFVRAPRPQTASKLVHPLPLNLQTSISTRTIDRSSHFVAYIRVHKCAQATRFVACVPIRTRHCSGRSRQSLGPAVQRLASTKKGSRSRLESTGRLSLVLRPDHRLLLLQVCSAWRLGSKLIPQN